MSLSLSTPNRSHSSTKTGFKPLPHTYLDTRVTNSQRPPISSRLKSERAQEQLETKKRLVVLAGRLGESELSAKLELCHSRTVFLTCGSHVVQAIPNYVCEFRLCPHCAARRGRKLNQKYFPKAYAFAMTRRVTPVHLVLTVKHREETLKQSIDRLMKAFRKLIRRDFWVKHFKGGLYSIERTKGRDGLHHTHLHVLAFRARFFDVGLLRSEWFETTGDSVNFNLKPVESIESGLREVLKYVAKPLDIKTFSEADLREFLNMKGLKFFNTFGEFRKFCGDFDEAEFEHVLSQIPRDDEFSHLVEGCACPVCEKPLLAVPVAAREVPDFLRRIEQSRWRGDSS